MAPTLLNTFHRLAERWITVVLVLVVVVSLAGLAAATGWEETWASLSALSVAQVALLLLLSLCNYVLRGVRWLIYNRVIGIPINFIQGMRHYLGGFALTVTPGRVGELVRLRWIHQETGFAYDRAAPLILVDRAADLAAIGLLLAASVALSATGSAGVLPVAILSVLAAILFTRQSLAIWTITQGWRVIGRWPGLFARLRRAARTLGPFSEPQIILPALILGGLGWFAEGLSFHLLLVWLGADIGLWTAVGIFLFAMVTGGATGAPGGLGGAEAAMVGLLTLQGVPLEVAVPATVIIRLTTLWFAIAIGVGVFPMSTYFANKRERAT